MDESRLTLAVQLAAGWITGIHGYEDDTAAKGALDLLDAIEAEMERRGALGTRGSRGEPSTVADASAHPSAPLSEPSAPASDQDDPPAERHSLHEQDCAFLPPHDICWEDANGMRGWAKDDPPACAECGGSGKITEGTGVAGEYGEEITRDWDCPACTDAPPAQQTCDYCRGAYNSRTDYEINCSTCGHRLPHSPPAPNTPEIPDGSPDPAPDGDAEWLRESSWHADEVEGSRVREIAARIERDAATIRELQGTVQEFKRQILDKCELITRLTSEADHAIEDVADRDETIREQEVRIASLAGQVEGHRETIREQQERIATLEACKQTYESCLRGEQGVRFDADGYEVNVAALHEQIATLTSEREIVHAAIEYSLRDDCDVDHAERMLRAALARKGE